MSNPIESEFIIIINVFVYFLSSTEQLELVKCTCLLSKSRLPGWNLVN